jgi:hypothetical protein
MTTRISIPLSELDEKFIRDLKEKNPGHIRMDIQLVDMDAIPSFGEEDFWSIISLIDLDAEGGPELALKSAVSALSEHPVSHIFLFEDFLAQKLFQLDTKAHAQAAYPEGRISVDGFLYVRAAVIASGKTRFEAVLATPALMPADEDFEELLSLAALAFELKTGTEFDYLPPVSYETYSNAEGWK